MTDTHATSLEKSLNVLFAFADPESDQHVFTVSALADELGMDKAQVSRTLAVFAKFGLIERLESRRGYQLGWASLHLASRALLAQVVSSLYPALSMLSTDIGESAFFSVRDGVNAVTLASFEPERRLYAKSWNGRPFPLIGSAVGYALLAGGELGEIRSIHEHAVQQGTAGVPSWAHVERMVQEVIDQGSSTVHDEFQQGVSTVAVPVYDVGNYAGRVYSAISVSAPTYRFPEGERAIREGLGAVAATANELLATLR
jgi:DNA-binding IclR family transcriptional regulator